VRINRFLPGAPSFPKSQWWQMAIGQYASKTKKGVVGRVRFAVPTTPTYKDVLHSFNICLRQKNTKSDSNQWEWVLEF
jgi:hypothetical protein